MISGGLAALRWDPQIRGILFPSIMFMILAGSSYVILATNMGNRLGFLVANAALWGWIAMMSVVWMIYGIGPKGRAPSWRGSEVITNTANAQDRTVAALPNGPSNKAPKGWKIVVEGSPTRGDASAALDAYLKKKITEGGAQLVPETGPALYASVSAFERGGDQYLKLRPRKEKGGDWYNPADYRFMGVFHGKRVYVEQIQFFKKDGRGAVVKDAKGQGIIDPSTTYTVVSYRDMGSLRQPPFVVFLSASTLLLVCCTTLHKRDKAVMSALAGGLVPARV